MVMARGFQERVNGALSWVDAFAESGVTVAFEDVRKLIGMGGDKLMPEVSGIEEETDKGRRIAERRKQIFMTTYLPQVRALPGTRQLLDKLEAAGLKRVIATSAKSDELAGLLKAADASELEESATTSDDADESKPEPDIVEAALERAGVGADGAIMIGDTPYDVEAASKAGVKIVAFRSGGWDDEGLSGAIAVYDDPADLLARFDSSPFGRGAHNPSR